MSKGCLEAAGDERSVPSTSARDVLAGRATAVDTSTLFRRALGRQAALDVPRGVAAKPAGGRTSPPARDAWMRRYQRVLLLIDFLAAAAAGTGAYLLRFGGSGV